MSESLIIRFSTKGLDVAARTLKEIKRRIGEAAKGIEDAGRRKEFLKTARELVAERQGEIKLLKDRARRRNLVADATADYNAAKAQADHVLRTLNSVREKGVAVAGALAGGKSLQGAVGALGEGIVGLVPGIGPVAQLASAVIGLITPALEQQSALREARITRALERRIENALRRADVARRFEDDPAYRREQGQIARDIVLRKQLAGTAFEPRGARLLGVL